MNQSIIASLLLILLAVRSDGVSAFAVAPYGSSSTTTRTMTPTTTALRATEVELKPEPEGGTELEAVSKAMPGSRMKEMGEATGLTGVRPDEGEEEDGSTIYNFWLSATVEGAMVKDVHSTVLRESAKNANFPGFRKGQVPPYAMPQIRGFAVQESITRTCQAAVDCYGLKSVTGSDGEVEVLEDIPELSKKYKVGEDLQFTATFNARYDPKFRQDEDESKEEEKGEDGAVIDVETTAATE